VEQEYIERRITVGAIVSTEFLALMSDYYEPDYIEAPEARLLLSWCLDYFKNHKKAPNRDIQEIFYVKKADLEEDRADFIADALADMSDEFDAEKFNYDYLWAQVKKHFKARHLELHSDRIKGYLEADDVESAEMEAEQYHPPKSVEVEGIYPFEDRAAVRQAFEYDVEPLFRFPGAFGTIVNEEFTRGSFVNWLAPEKRGKSFLLSECMYRAIAEGNDTAFFQAGDMSQGQQIRRNAIWLTKKSYKKQYCGPLYVPVLDCLKNQMDECDYEEGSCNEAEAPFAHATTKQMESKTYADYIALFKQHPDYLPCTKCRKKYGWTGAFWYRERKAVDPLTAKEAVRAMQAFGKKYRARLKLATYSNETLTTSIMRNQLWLWEHRENFVPSVIIVDYADLLGADKDIRSMPFRDQQNKIWQRQRAIAQDYNACYITASQADAASYDTNILKANNFSEDKRKNAHVTAGFGLNQTDDEKLKGIMRINSYLARDNDFSVSRTVNVLQRLQIGRPHLGSYF
jgi:uncharacterized protein with PIN domain